MPRGGPRPGGGRPKNGSKEDVSRVPSDIRLVAKKLRMTPLEYMLAVMNSDEADDARRDRMAQAAAPYVHARADTEKPGKKERQTEAAKTAGDRSDWGEDLNIGRAN